MKRAFVVDAYRRNPVMIHVLKIYENGSVYGDDSNGVRYFVTPDRILKIPIPDK